MTMLNVYVSSTFNDLKDHRTAVREILRQLDHRDVAMEYYSAEDQRPVDKCLSDVAACDIYVGIFAWRYGWRPGTENPDNHSITHMEYLRAKSAGKPCFIFTLDRTYPWTSEQDSDLSEITKLRDDLSELHGCKPFTNPDNLAAQVAVSLSRWKKPMLIQNTVDRIADEDSHHFIAASEETSKVSFLDHVKAALAQERRARHAVVLQGMGGVGKSSLAQEVANSFCTPVSATRFDIVWWIDSDGMSRNLTDPNDDALSDLADLARALPAEGGADAIDLQRKDWVRDMLAYLVAKDYRFLLIFDNACDGSGKDQLSPEQFAKRYFPKTNNVDQQVIVTSRNVRWAKSGFKSITMSTWSLTEYSQYFGAWGIPADNQALVNVHEQLGGLALAAAIAARYLHDNRDDETLESFAESLQDEIRFRETVDMELDVLNYSRPIHAAMTIAYRSLGNDARSLLHQIALMAPDDIPVLNMAANTKGTGLAANNPFASVKRATDAARELERAALIRRVSDKDEEFAIHRLIHFSVQQILLDKQQEGLARSGVTAQQPPANSVLVLDATVNATIGSFAGSTDRFKTDHYRYYKKLLPHIDAFTGYLMSRIEKKQVNITHESGSGRVLQTLLRDAGKYCFEVGNLALALRLFDFALIWSEGSEHEKHQINLDKAYGLMLRDRNNEAMVLCEAALKFYEKKHDGPDRLSWMIESRNKIGKIHQRTGEFREADACAVQCLEDLTTQGDEALNKAKRSGLLHDKAAARWDRGIDQQEAAAIFQEAIVEKKNDPTVDDTNLHLNFSHMIKGVAHVLVGDYERQRQYHEMAFSCFSKHDDREYRRYSYTAFYRLHFAWDEIGWENRDAALTDDTVNRMLDEYKKHAKTLDGDIKFRIIRSIVDLRQAVRKPKSHNAEKYYRNLMLLLENKRNKKSGRYIDDGTVAVSAVLDYGRFLLDAGAAQALQVLEKAEEMLQFKDDNGELALVQYHRREELEAVLRTASGRWTGEGE